ncbi:UV damage endonuclease UvdE [Peribacillus deserti]|uniref:UV damage endonuclease UvdE n=1 Tax=Peribacillus deserti TaxID=673318 RepID=A0ABS2QN45_9BACI|nr:UV DNA damage repair endonuclease UvsE [Peribacillus deserti]MBM7694582.1 UV damage endonuclease UvdE [Peribacillus deserti]
MTIVRLGYVAMSMHVQKASPSKTMTFAQFSKIADREAAIRKLERIAVSNLENCLRLLKHNYAHDIQFFRFSSRIIPLANHEELPHWNYLSPLKKAMEDIHLFLEKNPGYRVDFHPDHFVILNGTDKEIFNMSIKTLKMHNGLLRGMGIDPEHRCVVHVGGGYNDVEKALEQFIHNWGLISAPLQKMLMLENDDTTFTLKDTLYLCEKLGIPLVFDYHHHLAHHRSEDHWEDSWARVVDTWKFSKLPIKMHISSPRSQKDFRAHAEFVDSSMFLEFLEKIKGSVPQIDCMIEAKQKDEALFTLVRDLKEYKQIRFIDSASFEIR